MTVAIVDSTAGMAALSDEWEALWSRVGTTPFQSPRWLLPWWTTFGSGAPLVATIRRCGELVGILPAYVFAQEKVLPIGAGTTDYLDALGDGAEPMLCAVLARVQAMGVRRCDLIEVPPGSALRGVAVPDWQSDWTEGSPCPVLTLGQEPAGIRRKLRMNRHRAKRAGGWSVELATVDTLDEALAHLVTLHGARWAERGEPGVLSDPAVLAFHHEAGPGLLAAGLMRLAVLRVGGTVAAATMALLGPGRIFFYLSGYDIAHAFVSPGTLLLGAMLDAAAAEGRTEAHFLRGREAYKYAWGAVDRMNASGTYSASAQTTEKSQE